MPHPKKSRERASIRDKGKSERGASSFPSPCLSYLLAPLALVSRPPRSVQLSKCPLRMLHSQLPILSMANLRDPTKSTLFKSVPPARLRSEARRSQVSTSERLVLSEDHTKPQIDCSRPKGFELSSKTSADQSYSELARRRSR
jgi:hypothetical protein